MEEKVQLLEEMVEELGDHLAEGFYNTIKVLTGLVEITEKFYEGSHSRFIAEKSVELAEDLGMNDEDVMEVRIAALLHDIGKTGLSQTALYKYPSEMNPTEYKEYSQHPEIGQMILSPHPAFERIGEIIAQHHERLDGSGFPRHLKGDMIHPAAKIIAIVDIYHNAIFKRQRSKTATQNVKFSSSASYISSTKDKYTSVMNYLLKKADVLFEKKAVERFIDLMEAERRLLGHKTVMRLPANKIEPGMVFAEDYYSSFGMLIAAKGEKMTKDMLKALVRFAENGEIPNKLLVLK